MLINIIRGLVIVVGPIISYTQISHDSKGILIGVAVALLVIGAEIVIERVPLDALISAVIGSVLGLVSAQLLNWITFQLGSDKLFAYAQKGSLITHLVLAYLGMVLFVRKRSELELLDRDLIVKGPKKKALTTHLVDTSVLIDGRVADICETKFIAGTLVVPRFVLQELQAVADSPDGAKRARGRRGMDILARLQENPEVPVKIFDKDYPDVKEVDSKLVSLAKDLGAKILTTDFNLNKIASLQGVGVLNVNDLANALKPVVLPGETMNVFVLKEGKEREQGVAYLDDGTMVVVEDGRRAIGQKVRASVTSILQTSAGRMIFTKLARGAEPAAERAPAPAHPDL